MTTQLEKPRLEVRPMERPRTNRRLLSAVVVLTIAVLVLGGMLIYDLTSTSPTATTDEVAALVDEYIEAWNTYDGEALLALVTDSFVYDDLVAPPATGPQLAAVIDGNRAVNFKVEAVGAPLMIHDDGSVYYVAQGFHTNYLALDGIAVYTIYDTADGLRIRSHHNFMN